MIFCSSFQILQHEAHRLLSFHAYFFTPRIPTKCLLQLITFLLLIESRGKIKFKVVYRALPLILVGLCERNKYI